MKLCKYNEFILISKQLYFDDLCKALRQTYILKTNATTHYGSELFPSSKRRNASVHSFQVAAKNEHLISLQLRYLFRRKIRSFDSIVRSHIKYEVTKKPEKPRKIYGSVTTFSWLLLQKAKAPFTRSTRAPTYKATEIIISSMAYIICCCKANACLCQDIAQALKLL